MLSTSSHVGFPFVQYACSSCYNNNQQQYSQPWSPDLSYPLSNMYYCDACNQAKCPLCVLEEPVSFYCPGCLFELPSAAVKSERNRCARNCFQCPVCTASLSVVSSNLNENQNSQSDLSQQQQQDSTTSADPGSPATPNSTTNPQSSSGTHYLVCDVCHWDSLQVGWKFEKQTGIASQVQSLEGEPLALQEFNALREHYDKLVKYHAQSDPSSATSQSGGPSALSASLSSLLGSSRLTARLAATTSSLRNLSLRNQAAKPLVGPYEQKIAEEVCLQEWVHLNDVEHLRDLKSLVNVPTLAQKLERVELQTTDLSTLKPLRTHLRTKVQKRCKKCDHILIKPDTKSSTPKFTVKLMAVTYIPRITIIHPLPFSTPAPELHVNTPYTFHLKITNPLEHDIRVMLRIPDISGQKIQLRCSEFVVAGYSDFDDTSSGNKIPSTTKNGNAGLIEQYRNSTVVAFELNIQEPGLESQNSKDIEVPLQVVYEKVGSGNTAVEEEQKQHWIVLGIGTEI